MTPHNLKRLAQGLGAVPAFIAIALLYVLVWYLLPAHRDARVIVGFVLFLLIAISGLNPIAVTVVMVVCFLLIEWKLLRAAFLVWFRWSPLAARELTDAIFFLLSLAIIFLIRSTAQKVHGSWWLVAFPVFVPVAYILYRFASQAICRLAFPSSPTGESEPASTLSEPA